MSRDAAIQQLERVLLSECATHERYLVYLSQIQDIKVKRVVRFNMRCHKERIEILTFAVTNLRGQKLHDAVERCGTPYVISLKERDILRMLEMAESATLDEYNCAMQSAGTSSTLKELFDRQKTSHQAISKLRKQ